MTLGKLLGNNAQLFIFISILIMTPLISFLHFLLTAVRTGRLGVLPIRIYRGNNAASRLGDKFDRSMTLGKYLGNNAQLFICISILIMTQLVSFLHSLLTAARTGRLGVLPIRIYRGNNAVFVSVDLIGEKNQVILEYTLDTTY